jgi:hypothetical protein
MPVYGTHTHVSHAIQDAHGNTCLHALAATTSIIDELSVNDVLRDVHAIAVVNAHGYNAMQWAVLHANHRCARGHGKHDIYEHAYTRTRTHALTRTRRI